MYEEEDDSELDEDYQDSNSSINSSRSPNHVKPKSKEEILRFYDAQPILSFETEAIASQIMDVLFAKGGNKLYEKYLVTKQPDFQAKYWNGMMSALIQQGIMYGDPGESPKEIEVLWKEEKEPEVLHYDSRSTYAVNIDYKQVIIDETERDDSDARSIMSNSSRFSFASRKTNKLLSVSTKILTLSKINQQSMVDLSTKAKKPEKYQPELVRMPDEAPPEPDPIADRMRLAREKKDYVKSLELEKQRKQLQDELDFENRKKEAQRLLKHKQFTHDFNGDIIYLKKDRDQVPIPNNIINLDVKNRLPSEIVKEVKPPSDEGKKVKQINFKQQQKATLETIEFHNQPLLHLTLKPNPGNKIMTMQGQIMEGGFLSIQNRMRKGEYDKMIETMPNRPVANYLIATATNGSQQLRQDQIDEGKIPRLSLHSSSQMRIYNKDALVEMLQAKNKTRKGSQSSKGNIQMNTNESDNTLDDMREEYLQKEREKQDKETKRKELQKQIKLEKVTIYQLDKTIEPGDLKLSSALIQSTQAAGKKKEPITRLHLEVEKFDKQNIKDPTWGDPNVAKSQMLMVSEENKKPSREPVTFKIRKQQKLINSNKSLKMTASKFFNS